MNRVYLDYAATTPVDPRVLRVMEPYFGTGAFGNPGSLHSFGQAAIAALDQSRETIARLIGAEFRSVIFTSSATEANTIALRGAVRRAMADGRAAAHAPRIIVSAIEHESVLATARDLERDGIEVVYLPVDRKGIIDLAKLRNELTNHTILVSIMYANNEIGTVQPIKEIAKVIRDHAFRAGPGERRPLFHTDAVQAFPFLDCNVEELGVDMMTISSHKIYGPKGAAALFIRTPGSVSAVTAGGGQEFGIRSGTENVPAIVGFAKAAELAAAAREKEAKRIGTLRAKLWQGIARIAPKAETNGGGLPNILNVYFPGYAAQELLTRFDLAGLAVSSGSACRSRASESSYVIEALGYPEARATSSIRFSLGRPTTAADILKTLRIVGGVVR